MECECRLSHLILTNFRSYQEARLSFSPKVNCIVGANAQGKTNLLEALYFLSTGRSFRTPHLFHLIRREAPFFSLEAHFVKENVAQALKITYDGKTRRILHNQTSLRSLSQLFGILPVVIYSPDDVQLITGAPAKRRRFLDIHISQYDPLYLAHLVRYFQAMKQRNHLLKSQEEASLSIWEEQMARSGAYLIEKRKEALITLCVPLQRNLALLSGQKETIDLAYHTSFPVGQKEEFAALLAKGREKERRLGSTLIGPHRDDLFLSLNSQEARLYASEGQKRCCACSLRLAEWQLLKERLGVSPLFCIDDFGVHLDEMREKFLKEALFPLGQLFLTSPKPLSFCETKERRHFHIREGAVMVSDGAKKPVPEETLYGSALFPLATEQIAQAAD